MITLQPLLHHGQLCVALRGIYSGSVSSIIKDTPGIKYTKTHKCWYLPFDAASYARLMNVLTGFGPVKLVDNDAQGLGAALFSEKHKKSSIQVPALYHETLRKLRYSDSTCENYCIQFKKFLEYITPTPAEELTPAHIHDYMIFLVDQRQVSASTQNMAINAINATLSKCAKRSGRSIIWTGPASQRSCPRCLARKNFVRL